MSDAPTMIEERAGDAIELNVLIEPGAASEFGVTVYCDREGKGGFPISPRARKQDPAIGSGESALRSETRRARRTAHLS